jgi:hypothetical protein
LKGKKQGARKLPDTLFDYGRRFKARANLHSREMLKYKTRPEHFPKQFPAYQALLFDGKPPALPEVMTRILRAPWLPDSEIA